MINSFGNLTQINQKKSSLSIFAYVKLTVTRMLSLQAELMPQFVEACIYFVAYFITTFINLNNSQQQQRLAPFKAPRFLPL